MTLEQIEKRKKELLEEIEKADTKERIAELQEEVRKLSEEKEKIEVEAREKRNLINEVVEGKGKKLEGGASTTMTREERAKKLKNILSSEAYEIAYAEDIKHNTDKNTRSLLTDLVTGGSVPVPTYLEERINTNWESNEIYNLVNKTYFKGVAKIPFELSATDAEMHEEGAAAPNEEELVLGTVESYFLSISNGFIGTVLMLGLVFVLVTGITSGILYLVSNDARGLFKRGINLIGRKLKK